MNVLPAGFCRLHSLAGACLATLFLAGCGGLSLWPFGNAAGPVPRGYENATPYRCEGGKGFHVRLLENGNAAWLILPERQVRLERKGDGAYSNGLATLKLDAGTLDDTSAISWRGCKAGG